MVFNKIFALTERQQYTPKKNKQYTQHTLAHAPRNKRNRLELDWIVNTSSTRIVMRSIWAQITFWPEKSVDDHDAMLSTPYMKV